MNTYLTFDYGTTSIKTCVVDQNMKMIATHTEEYDLITKDDHIEMNPDKYYQGMKKAVAYLLEAGALDDVKAICMTGQGETMIPVDKAGKSLHNAIVWLDERAFEQADRIKKTIDIDDYYIHTGVSDINGMVPIAKYLWIKENLSEVYDNMYKLLLLEDYLIMRLTGQFVTEKSLQTSTGWYDIKNDCYMTELLNELELSEKKLPGLMESGSFVGTISDETAKDLGLNSAIKVITGGMDQICAAIGGGGLRDNVITATVGTCMVLATTMNGNPDIKKKPTFYRGYKSGQNVVLPICNSAGVVFKWLKDIMFKFETQECKDAGRDVYDYLCELADTAQVGSGGTLLLPYFQGSLQPKLIPNAKGVFYGISLNTGKAELVRSVLESIGFMLRENVEMLRDMGICSNRVFFFGGGSKNRIWNQIIADITGMELVLLQEKECASMGAAMFAAVALGDKTSIEEAQESSKITETIKPDKVRHEKYESYYQKYIEVFNAIEGTYST